MSDRADHIQGFVFVHGINQTQADLDGMQDWVEGLLRANGLLDRLTFTDQRRGTTQKMVWCGKWRSLGNFMADIVDLATHKVRRDQAVSDIQTVIQLAWAALGEAADTFGFRTGITTTNLVVCGHSMGQPLALAALHGLSLMDSPQRRRGNQAAIYPVPTSFLSAGGPMGNSDPVVDGYLLRGLDGSPWIKTLAPTKPAAIHEWVDMWNPLDPIASDPIFGSHQYPGSTHQMFKVPGQPQLPRPFENVISEYHSAYFQHPEIYQTAGRMLDGLISMQGG